jgi:hypothetical protein
MCQEQETERQDSHALYILRLRKTKGSMEEHREMFGRTSPLVLYEFGKPDKLSVYTIAGHKEMGKKELISSSYPNPKPQKLMALLFLI